MQSDAMAALDLSADEFLELPQPRDAVQSKAVVRAHTLSTRLMVGISGAVLLLAPIAAFAYSMTTGEGLTRAVGGAVCIGIGAGIVCTPVLVFWRLQRRDLLALIQYGERVQGTVVSSQVRAMLGGRFEALSVTFQVAGVSHCARMHLLLSAAAGARYTAGDGYILIAAPTKPSLIAGANGRELVIGRAEQIQ